MNKQAIIALAVAFSVGLLACRAGQRVVESSYNNCMEAGIESGEISTYDQLLELNDSCKPSSVSLAVFYW